eukprot:gene12700-14909_t
MKTNRFLMLLKTRGTLTAAEIAKELGITSEGARLQLLKFMEDGLVSSAHESNGVGRPKQLFSLTELGHAGFPDTHAELTVKLIGLVKNTLGEDALQKVIDAAEQSGKVKYLAELEAAVTLEERISGLVGIRTREGYMAEYVKETDGYLLVENHCPICAAAKTCQGLCVSELNTFRSVLGNEVQVDRIDHIIAGARRCAYRITRKENFS